MALQRRRSAPVERPLVREGHLKDLSDADITRIFRPNERFSGFLGAPSVVQQVGLFYHAAHLEAFGRAAPLEAIPPRIAKHIARVLEVDLPEHFVYPDVHRTYFTHAEKVRRALGWQKFSPSIRKSFEKWLAKEARRSTDHDYLRELLIGRLLQGHIVLPAPYRIDRVVGRARTVAQEWITKAIISSGISDRQMTAMNKLRHIRPDTDRSYLQWMKDPIGAPSPRTLEDILDRLTFLRGFDLAETLFEKIHPDMRRRMTKTVEVYSTDSLWTDFPTERRQAYVACYLYERRRELVDLAIEAFDGIVLGMHRRSEADLAEDQRKRGPAINEKLLMFRTMATIMLDPEVSDPAVRPMTFREIPRDTMAQALAEVEELIRPVDYNYLDYMERRYTYVRSFFPHFLRVMEFDGLPRVAPLLEAVALLRYWNAEGIRKITTDVPLEFLSDKWKPYVTPEEGKFNRRYYELAVLDTLHAGLKSGDVWAVSGRRYGNVEDLLIPLDEWKRIRTEMYSELRLPLDPREWLAESLHMLTQQIERTTTNLAENPQTYVEGEQVHLHTIDGVQDPDPLRALKKRVNENWPQVRIQDLLVEVDSWIGFTRRFRTLSGRKANLDFSRGLLAALIAKGCNIGTLKMAALAPGITEGTLRRVDELYLYEDPLRESYELLQSAQNSLPMAGWLGDADVSMSDGMRVQTRVGTLRASLHPHLLGPGKRALTYYFHILHQGPGYAAQVIGHDRDAAYVLDQIFHIQSELPIHEHYTDTHGATENTFALAYPFGIEFSPRIKAVHDQDLYHPPGMKVHGPFAKHFAGPVDTELIATQWDDFVRILASIRRGHTSAVLLSLRLSSYARQNPLYRALREVGRIYKTCFIMRYYDEPAYRRRIHAGLSRMEHFNHLARILFYARRGENWEREFDQQLNRASALLFLANACVLWNTVRLTEIYKQLQKEGMPCSPEDFRHISPYASEHIIPYGEYHFRMGKDVRRAAYQAARTL